MAHNPPRVPRTALPTRLLGVIALPLLLTGSPVAATAQTVGLIQNDPGSFAGYTLFAPNTSTETYLIDHDGLFVQSWSSAHPPGNSAYLLDDGHLLRTANAGGNPVFLAGGAGGLIEEFDWDGTPLWEFEYSNQLHRQHHDLAMLPGGNLLLIAWELKTHAEALAAGRDPALLSDNVLWPDHLVEIEPAAGSGGSIVWEWHVWDHLIQDHDPARDNFGVVGDHPELVDLNFAPDGRADWLHMNGVDYNPELDQIVVSVPRFGELWVIDHSTTTAEAAGHGGGLAGRGGDLLYRWGDPQTYRAGTGADRRFFGQHDANWIDAGLPGAGHVLVFNNGNGRPDGAYSTVEEIETTVDAGGQYPLPPPGSSHGPAAPTWVYTAVPPTSLYAHFISGAGRQPNGNTLICDGPHGSFFEVTPSGDTVWRYINPVTAQGPLHQGEPVPPTGPNTLANLTFRCYRYGPDFSGFTGRDLTPGGPIELYPTGVEAAAPPIAAAFELRQNRPNPFNPSTRIDFKLEGAARVSLEVHDALGRFVARLVDARLPAGEHGVDWQPRGLRSGAYFYALRVDGATVTRRMLLLE